MSRAVVLSGGGRAGAAWMLGLAVGLREAGVDLADADLIVGTSGGARTGAQLATGIADQAVTAYRAQALPAVMNYAGLPDFVAAARSIRAAVGDQAAATRQIANLGPLGPGLASAAERRQEIAAYLPVDTWPGTPLKISAVDADSGHRVVFDARSGVSLTDAVTASCALPGIYPLAEINGRRYADGGAWSLYSADLAAGHDVVIVISPFPLDPTAATGSTPNWRHSATAPATSSWPTRPHSAPSEPTRPRQRRRSPPSRRGSYKQPRRRIRCGAHGTRHDRFKPPARSRAVAREIFDSGAVITGRRTFDSACGWGGHHPLGCPFFLLTRNPPDRWTGPGTGGTWSPTASKRPEAGPRGGRRPDDLRLRRPHRPAVPERRPSR
jgi:NTE family protein